MKERIKELKNQGLTYNQIGETLTKETGEYYSWQRVRGLWRRSQEEKAQPKYKSVIDAIQKPATFERIMAQTGLTPDEIINEITRLKATGHTIVYTADGVTVTKRIHSEPKRIRSNWNGDHVIKFGVVSDTHLGSKYTQLSFLHQAYDAFEAEGITTVYHAGDITEGERMRPGHEYECYIHGADEHAQEINTHYPKRDGITTFYILGNHDAAFVRHAGLNISKMINRDDLICLGFDSATIEITPNCKLELRHPGGGSAYSISYKSQKAIDAMSGGEKPNILILGHYHKQEYIFYRNVHCLQAGTLQAQSGFMKRLALAAHVGFYIVTIHVDDNGQINRFLPEWRPFYQSIEEDYKNFVR
jgi:predicted phosphodiesterase